jgi:tripartite-type tricarboxylate transporter receptor subunit TctC
MTKLQRLGQVGISTLATLALLAGAASTQEANYPTRPIQMIIPFAPGGASDFVARIMQPGLNKLLGQQIVIENRPGAAGQLGTEVAARAAPDGYTIFLGNVGTVSINPSLFPTMRVKPDTELAPVSLVAETPGLLITRLDFPADSVKELVAYVKANPGKVSFASPGSGSLNRLEMEVFRHEAGLEMTHIPYKGGAGPAVTDILGGHVDLMFTTISSAIEFVKDKKVKALAITTRERLPSLPDIPTMLELGWKNNVTTSWQGVFVPAGTPRPIIDRLHDALAKTVADPDVKQRMEKGGVLAVASASPEDFKAYIQPETAKWGKVVHESGATPD